MALNILARMVKSSPAPLAPIPPTSDAAAGRTWRGAHGLPLAVSLYGPADAAPVAVFAHGFGQTRHAWTRTMRALAERGLASAAYDLRGHGGSGRNAGDTRYDVAQFIDDALAVRAQIAGSPVLVGASMGGLVGLAAQARGAAFAGLVLVDVTPRWEIAGMQRILAFMGAHADGFEDHEHAAREIAAYLPHRREKKTPADLAHLLVTGDDGRLRWHWDPRLLEDLADSAKHQHALSEAARGIDVPVLLVSGGRSDLVSRESVEHFLSLVPHAAHVQLPEATHMVAGDDNGAFTRAVVDFLAALRLADPETPTPSTLRGASP